MYLLNKPVEIFHMMNRLSMHFIIIIKISWNILTMRARTWCSCKVLINGSEISDNHFQNVYTKTPNKVRISLWNFNFFSNKISLQKRTGKDSGRKGQNRTTSHWRERGASSRFRGLSRADPVHFREPKQGLFVKSRQTIEESMGERV